MTFFRRVLLGILAPIMLILVSSCAPSAGLAPPANYETAEKAVLAYEKALQNNPDDAQACMWLGFIRLDQGQMENGKQLLTKAVLHDPSLTEAFFKLGQLAEEDNKSKEALGFYQKAIDGNETFRAVIESKYALERARRTAISRMDNANALLVEGEFTEALDILNSTLDDLPAEPRLHQLLARAYVGLAETKLAYAERKNLFSKASSALNEAADLGAVNRISSIKADIAHLRTVDEDEVAEARELVEAGGRTFGRQVCLGQKVPLLEIRNRSSSKLTLDLKFANDAKQWVVAANNVSLRSGPGKEFDRIGRLPRGTVAWIRQMPEGEYWNVVTPVGEGWLSSRLLDRSAFVKLTIPSGQTREIVLSPGTAEYRLGRGIKNLAEGKERFMPYLCYSWP